jgi:hypothetical protein
MVLEPVWSLLEAQLFAWPSQPGLFNPYRDQDPRLDHPEAVLRRRQNLRHYLSCFGQRPPVFLLAEAPGPWGCRFSGVPLTSEAQLSDPAFPVRGQPTSLHPTPHHEYSARIYWRVLQPWFPQFFTWNSVPLHPHRIGSPLSIRTPSPREVRAFGGLLAELLAVLRPLHVVAIGRKAAYALAEVGVPAHGVRHPSQGGARLFAEGVQTIFREAGLATGR